MTGGLEGTTALVTGGGTGIGLGCAQRLAADGAVVVVCGRRESVLADAVSTIGHGARYVVCDVTDEAQVAALIAASGGPRIVVANAGGSPSVGPLVLTDLEGWNNTIALNLTSALSLIKHAAPAMAQAGGGSIVAISSIAGALTHRYLAAYAVSKGAVEALVRNAADELGRFGIRVNAVRPGLVPTDTSTPLYTDEHTRQDYLEQMPLGRLGTVEDVAGAVRFLAGPDSSWITGQVFAVDGGHSLRRGPDLGPLFDPFFDGAVSAALGVEATAGD